MSSSKPLVLVDGSSYLYRAFHALPPLTNSKGAPTGAVKGVISMLRRLVKDYPGSPIAVIFDAKGKTFRDEIYAQYKAHRPPMPDELRAQVEPIHAIIRAMGLPMLVIEGVEADDVIGTLAVQAHACQYEVVISTGDKDMAQLVGDHVTLVNTMTATRLDVAGVQEKFGFAPPQVIDFLALMGDKIDNIPGVPGVGEKTAMGLIQGLGDLDAIYANLDEVAGLPLRGARALAVKLNEFRDQAYLSKQLATIKTDVPLELAVTELQTTQPDVAGLLHWFNELEFRTWVEELEQESVHAESSPPPPPQMATHYETVFSKAALDGWLERLKQAPCFAFDTETTGLDYMKARIVGVSFAVEPGTAAYVPFGHDYPGAPDQLDETDVLGALKPLLEDDAVHKVGQNLKYDAHVLLNHGIVLRGIRADVMLESYVLNSIERHDMDSLSRRLLQHETVSFEAIAGKGVKQLTFNQIDLETAGHYAAEDADITLRLHQCLWPQLLDQPALLRVFEDIELPLIQVLLDIEHRGTLVNARAMEEHSRELGEQLHLLEQEAYGLAGRPFNLSSPKQLGQILFEEQKIPVGKKTAKGAASTAEDVLQELAYDYPLPKVILQHRGLAKLKSTYTDKLSTIINPGTGRVHTSYHQAVAATGRLSSADPNLQNIPIRTEQGRRIRKAFIAPAGYKIFAADYSQIELRIMAHLSGDASLLAAFSAGLDVHKATAGEVFGVPWEEVTSEQRRRAKAINFGLIYGMSAFGLARQLHISRGEAQQYIDLYFERYPGVRAYMDRTRQFARDHGYVETLNGRRLYVPEINARNPMRRQGAERTAINAPMQGSAADIIKKAMINVHRWLRQEQIDVRMIMQVHDELVFEIADPVIETASREIVAIMSAAQTLSVPLLVDSGIGMNWDEAH